MMWNEFFLLSNLHLRKLHLKLNFATCGENKTAEKRNTKGGDT